MEEGEVKLNLNVLDLPGFGDEIDNSRWLNEPLCPKNIQFEVVKFCAPKHNPYYAQVLAPTCCLHRGTIPTVSTSGDQDQSTW